jgi:hypothetical protein
MNNNPNQQPSSSSSSNLFLLLFGFRTYINSPLYCHDSVCNTNRNPLELNLYSEDSYASHPFMIEPLLFKSMHMFGEIL